jgi:hypothetical protein
VIGASEVKLQTDFSGRSGVKPDARREFHQMLEAFLMGRGRD